MKTISLEQAAEYFSLHSELAKTVKRMDELKPVLLEALIDGAVSPPDLPFLLENRPQQRKQSDWKGYALKLLGKLLKSKKKALAEFEKVDSKWEVKECAALHVVINPEFRVGE